MSDHKTPERKEIVKARLKAKRIWNAIELPNFLEKQIRDEHTGNRNTHVVPITETIEHLEEIGDKIFRLNANKHYVAISADDPRRISYAKEPEHKFDRRRRTRTTLIKYVGKTFPELKPHMNEQALELFGSNFRAEATGAEDNFHIVRGEQILDYYRDHYAEGTCMTGCHSHYVKIYTKNDNCALLCYEDDDYTGRALLWTTDQGTQVCDRIYPNGGPHIEAYKQYCRKYNIIMRTGNGYPRTSFSDEGIPPGNNLTDSNDYSITLLRRNLQRMPYMDLFTWGAYTGPGSKITLYNRPFNSLTPPGDITFICTSTSGKRNTWSNGQCCSCETAIKNGHYTFHKNTLWCNDCVKTHLAQCERCSELERNRRIRTIHTFRETGVNEQFIPVNEQWCSPCRENNAKHCYGDHCNNYYYIPTKLRRAMLNQAIDSQNNGNCIKCYPLPLNILNQTPAPKEELC